MMSQTSEAASLLALEERLTREDLSLDSRLVKVEAVTVNADANDRPVTWWCFSWLVLAFVLHLILHLVRF